MQLLSANVMSLMESRTALSAILKNACEYISIFTVVLGRKAHDCAYSKQLRSSSFSALACKAKQASDCWSAAQVNAIERLHQDYIDGDEYLYSGVLPGTSGVARVLGPTGDPLAIDYFRYFLYK